MFKQLSQIYPLTLLVVMCFTVFHGCTSIQYYQQAASGHLSLMMSTEPVDDWLADEAMTPELRAKLQLSQKARLFARDQLHLPLGDAFSEYAELDRPWVLVNLVAAPEFSLDAHQWCYPFVGCQSYRGYYDLEDARDEARVFTDQGYDTSIGGVTAYSTLGWFDDPLHTGFTRLSDSRMVALMFHELAHQVVYIREDTAFNESFATAVELEGLRKWLQQRGDTRGFDRALDRLRQREQTLAVVENTTGELRRLYSQRNIMAAADMRERKTVILEQLRSDYLTLAAGWDQPGPLGADPESLNNANLALFRQYNQYVSAFRQLFRESGQRFDDFYPAVRQLSELGPEQRLEKLTTLGERFDEHL